MVQSIICKGKRYTGIGLDDLALIELLNAGKTSAPRDVIERLDNAGLIDLENRGGKRVWALTAKGRLRAQAVAPLETRLRQHYSGSVAAGCALKCVSTPGFTMAPRSRRLS